MSRVNELREKYTESGPTYNLQGSAMRHQKELLLEIACEIVSQNEKLDKLIELLTPKEDILRKEADIKVAATPRQKVTA